MRKVATGLLIVLSMALGCLLYWMRSEEDVTPPVIAIPEEEIIFKEGDDHAVLLDGVTAMDDVDGDVSDSLVVESVIPMDEGQTATVIYYAKDRSNNISKRTRTVSYRAKNRAEWLDEIERLQETESETEKKNKKDTPESSASESETESEGQTGEAQTDETQTVGEVDRPEISVGDGPILRLSTNAITVSVGDSVNPLDYIEDISDDKDSKEHLYGQIHIDSNNVDTSVPGEYEIVYSVTDSDDNFSPQEVLKVTVKE